MKALLFFLFFGAFVKGFLDLLRMIGAAADDEDADDEDADDEDADADAEELGV